MEVYEPWIEVHRADVGGKGEEVVVGKFNVRPGVYVISVLNLVARALTTGRFQVSRQEGQRA